MENTSSAEDPVEHAIPAELAQEIGCNLLSALSELPQASFYYKSLLNLAAQNIEAADLAPYLVRYKNREAAVKAIRYKNPNEFLTIQKGARVIKGR